VAVGQMSTVAPRTTFPSVGMCCCDTKAASSPFPDVSDSSTAKPNSASENQKSPSALKICFFLLPSRMVQRAGKGWFNKPRQLGRGELRMRRQGQVEGGQP